VPGHHDQDKAQSLSERRKIAQHYLPKAMERIVKLIDGAHSERIQLDASIWVAEMVLGKPKQEIEGTASDAVALELAKALRHAIEHTPNDSLQAGIVVEGGVRILGALPQPAEA
jgi:hypothetical protein